MAASAVVTPKRQGCAGAVAASLLLGESNPKRFAVAACATMIYEQKLQRWVMVVAQQPEMQSVANCQRLQPRAA